MAKERPQPPDYHGIYTGHRLTINEARPKVVEALTELFKKDAMLLTLDVAEECIVHKLGKYLEPKFPDLNVDVEYNGWFDRHPKYLHRLVERFGTDLHRKEAYPDVLAHWRRKPVNVLVVEVKRTKNTAARSRDIDHFKLSSFTAPELPMNETFHYHVGLFLDIATGDDVDGKLYAKATWYVDGDIEIKAEELCPTPYTGP